MSRRAIAFSAAFAVILVGDLVTKAIIVTNMRWREGFPVIDGFFNIVRAHNRGAAFGLLSDGNPTFVIPFFVIVAIAALAMLVSLLRRLPADRILAPAILGAIGGGAVGNLIDRIRRGYVVDFLDFHVRGWHWPAFNVADIGISVGVTILVILSLTGRDDGLFSDDSPRD